MRINLPYIFQRGSKIYYRRRLPANLISQFGCSEIKISIGPATAVILLLPLLQRLAVMDPEEVCKMAWKKDDFSRREMMTSAWDGIAGSLLQDPPNELSPSRRAVLDAISEVFNSPPPPVGPSLSEAVEEYILAPLGSKGPSALKNMGGILREFLRVMERYATMPVSDINRQDINFYTKWLQNTNLHPNTKSNKMMWIRQFFTWLDAKGLNNNQLEKAFITIFNPPTPRSARSSNKIYSEDIIDIIYGHIKEFRNYNPAWENSDFCWRYWLFVVCLFHGCRPGEASQLHLDDIIDYEGIPCINIREGVEKKLKNADSPRIIPIHPLIRDDFLKYVDDRRARMAGGSDKNKIRVFALSWHPVNGCTQAASRWYRGNMFPALGISGFSLSDTRPTFETRASLLPLSDAEKRIMARITGRAVEVSGIPHSTLNIMKKHYIVKDYPPDMMLSVIKKVVFPLP